MPVKDRKVTPAAELPSLDEILQLVSYDPDTGVFTRTSSGNRADRPMTVGYRRVRVTLGGKKFELLAHRLAWFVASGVWPDDEIDHINGNRHDNRIVNLRHVSRAENAKNAKRRLDNSSGLVGVSRHQKGWRVRIAKEHVGCSHCFWVAVQMRRAAERSLKYHENHGRP